MDREDFEWAHKRLIEMAKRAGYRGENQFTRFLEPPVESYAVDAAREGGVRVMFFGGYEDAERRMACFYTDEPPDSWPIHTVLLKWNAKYASVGHRDILGAVMAQGMTRDCLGDLLIDSDRAYLFATAEAREWLKRNLDSAGRAKIAVEDAQGEVILPKPKGEVIRQTVSSMRLDAVIKAAFSLSRGDAQLAIERGHVQINHIVTEKSAAQVEENDLISVRGYGRARVQQVLGETKKGRIAIALFRYGKT